MKAKSVVQQTIERSIKQAKAKAKRSYGDEADEARIRKKKAAAEDFLYYRELESIKAGSILL